MLLCGLINRHFDEALPAECSWKESWVAEAFVDKGARSVAFATVLGKSLPRISLGCPNEHHEERSRVGGRKL